MTALHNQGVAAGYQSGDLLYLSFIATHAVSWDPTLQLEELFEAKIRYQAVNRECGYQSALDESNLVIQMYKNFRGLTNSDYSLDDTTFSEEECLRSLREMDYVTGITVYHLCKAEILFAYGKAPEALTHINKGSESIQSVLGLFYTVRYALLTFLINAALYATMSSGEREKARFQMRKSLKKIKDRANHFAENFLHLQLLMEAELSRINGKTSTAIQLYNHSIKMAQQNNFLRDEAMASELAARFLLSINLDKAAERYVNDAYYLYKKWGADRKAKRIEIDYPEILNIAETRPTSGTVSISSSKKYNQELDLTTVVKSSQAISQEIVLEQLLTKMMKIVIENAGAQKGVLVVKQDDNFFVEAEASAEVNLVKVNHHLSVTQCDSIARTIVDYVVRTGEDVVLDDAFSDESSKNDPYIKKSQVKSLLCLPLIHKGMLSAILYLENNMVNGAFSQERVDLLKLLSAEIVISLENAYLYKKQEEVNLNLERKVKERTAEFERAMERISEQSNEQKELLHILCHDLSNPFNSMSSLMELAAEDSSLFENLSPLINVAIKNGMDTIELVRQMRALEDRTSQLVLRKTNLNQMVQDSITILNQRFQAKDLELVQKIDPKHDILVEPISFVNSVLNNLLSNAIKFSFPGSRVTIESVWQKGWVTLSVRDYGTGMSEELINGLFDFSVSTSRTGTNGESGTGFGMPLVKKFVNAYGGALEIKSKVKETDTIDHGTEMIISLKSSDPD